MTEKRDPKKAEQKDKTMSVDDLKEMKSIRSVHSEETG